MANRGTWREICPRWIKHQISLMGSYQEVSAHRLGEVRRSLMASHQIWLDSRLKKRRRHEENDNSEIKPAQDTGA